MALMYWAIDVPHELLQKEASLIKNRKANLLKKVCILSKRRLLSGIWQHEEGISSNR